MGRLVQEKIKQPLAEELLFGKLVNGGEVKVRIKDNAPAFEITPAPPKPAKGKAVEGKGRAKPGSPPAPKAPRRRRRATELIAAAGIPCWLIRGRDWRSQSPTLCRSR